MRHPDRFRFFVGVAAVAATFAVGATRARADLAPPDSCTSPGQACMTAGPQFNQAGTCVTMTCTKQVPAPDGGTMTMTYDCHRCVAGATGGATGTGSGGATGTGGGGGSGGATGTGGATGAGGSTSQPTSKSSGCAVASERGDGGSLAVMTSLVAGLMLAAARRRNTRA